MIVAVELKTLVAAPNYTMNDLPPMGEQKKATATFVSTSEKTVFVIAGPTAVGKTAIAISLAEKLGTAIVSGDSRQCYKEMSIGTAKPSREELSRVRHYFVDAFPITESITAADYERLALQYLNEIFEQHDTAVVCGGTGLYLKALTEGLDDMPSTNAAIEQEVTALFEKNGLTWLQETVKSEDPEFFASAETENPARLLRALAFKRSTGKSIIQFRTGTKKVRPFRIIKCALQLPRETLYERINSRVDQMMAQGLLEEVAALQPQRQLKNLQTVGYAELFDYLDGRYTLSTAVEKIKQHTRNYAKRQLTWFKKDTDYRWFDAADEQIVETILALKN